MAPRDGVSANAADGDNNQFKHLLKKPQTLKLEFSQASEYDRFNELFNPKLLKAMDPTGYVAKRLDPDFRKAVKDGCAIGLSDENSHLRTLVVNYHFFDKQKSKKQHDYTELGSVLSCMQGYGSGGLLAAALGLKEWFNHPPKKAFVTEIKHDNVAPTKIYKMLGYEPLNDKKMVDRLFYLCYSNVADDQGNPVSGPPMDEKDNIGFYEHTNKTVISEAGILLKFMDQGGVTNKQGDLIQVDFSDLDRVGLTRPRLEAISKGELSRKKLMKIGANKGSPAP